MRYYERPELFCTILINILIFSKRAFAVNAILNLSIIFSDNSLARFLSELVGVCDNLPEKPYCFPPRHIGKFELKQHFIFLPSLLRPELIKGNDYEA